METVRPEDFFTDNPPTRIMGTEVENSVLVGEDQHIKSNLVHKAIKAADRMGGSSFKYTGGRLYSDLMLAEDTTPECLGAAETYAYERVGRQVLKSCAAKMLADGSIETLYGPIYFAQISAYHNAVTGKDEGKISATGYHENYLIPAKVKEEAIPVLLSLLAVRDIVCGSGYFDMDGNFSVGAKVHEIGETISTRKAAQGNKPMILNLSTVQNHAEHEDWQRVEVRCGDITVTPWASVMKLGMCSLALRLVEHQAFPKKLLLNHPYETFQQLATSEDGIGEFRNIYRKPITTMQWLRGFAEAVLKLAERVQLPDDELKVAQELLLFVDDYEADPTRIIDRSEQAAKLYIARERNMGTNAKKLQTLQAWWARLDETDGIAGKLMAKGFFRTDTFDIPEANEHTQPATRASLRVAIFNERKDRKDNASTGIVWMKCLGIPTPDPYQRAA